MTSPPTALRIHEVPIDLKCPICFDVPLRPNITPCQHLFCDVCLEQALLVNKACPICRFDCTSNQMRSLEPGTLIHRVWSSIEVKCTNHQGSCQWTGSIGDYGNHLEQCGQCFHARLANMEDVVEELIQMVEKEKKANQLNMRNMRSKLNHVRRQNAELKELLEKNESDFRSEIDRLQKQTEELEKRLQKKQTKINNQRNEIKVVKSGLRHRY